MSSDLLIFVCPYTDYNQIIKTARPEFQAERSYAFGFAFNTLSIGGVNIEDASELLVKTTISVDIFRLELEKYKQFVYAFAYTLPP
jgi:hypothetical protein